MRLQAAPGARGTAIRTAPISTHRLTLLPLQVTHATEMAAVLADPALHTFIGGTPSTPEELRLRYERLVAGSPDPAVSWHNWVLLLTGEKRLAGTVQATLSGTQDAEIAWVVGTPWQGHGLASEAARGLVRHLRQQGVRTITAHIHPAHHASAAVARAAGLSPTGEQQDGETTWRLDTPPPEAVLRP
ncbi:GNAT family N-acetyltransferase [Streptomyces sp. DSM 15324]|uniref:GNAT family N-acetyltransferase n=1 Tax=Streptomyces sp. DSM 15324 TaxID=1739111 RepID=UPI00074A51C5|nr:GNAT family N-acetyltransferase [Streptomyces sp. DSM 15324]KUO13722.1 GCN5 family acetyltransferase [Streptomyces sp. DSM 15324]